MGCLHALEAEGLQVGIPDRELYASRDRDRYDGPPSCPRPGSPSRDGGSLLLRHPPSVRRPILKSCCMAGGLGVTQFRPATPSIRPAAPTCPAGEHDPSLSARDALSFTGPILSDSRRTPACPSRTSALQSERVRPPLPTLSRSLGNAPIGCCGILLLESDFTLARRVPIKVGRGANLRIQLQCTRVQTSPVSPPSRPSRFTANGTTTRRTRQVHATTNPLNVWLTMRLDF